MNKINYSRINFIVKKCIENNNNNNNNFRYASTKTINSRDSKWKSVVGLEIHAQINSNSKLFSASSSNYGSPTNHNVSFFDCGTPGTLPVLNKRCVEAGISTALALSCKINEVSLFDRKHYFYADSPTGYQITQQRRPLAFDGELKFHVYAKGIHNKPYKKISKIKQLQLEQDSGKSLHDAVARRSLVDLNRAGVPLMELVFEPDLTDGEEAAALVKELILILQRLGTCSCKMEEGGLRVDANVSVNKEGDESLGTRTEVKNIGSIRSVAAAVDYEIDRQISEIENGGRIINETRSWDMEIRRTVPMRDKEDKQDYRFMPEPNLPPLHVHVDKDKDNSRGLIDVTYLFNNLPELPEETRNSLMKNFLLDYTTVFVLVNEDKLLKIFRKIVHDDVKRDKKLVANLLVNNVLTLVNKGKLVLDDFLSNYKDFGQLIDLLQNRIITLNTAKKLLEDYMTTNERKKTPLEIIEDNNWTQITDENELTAICKKVLEDNPDTVKQYKNGKIKVFKSLVGAVAKYSKNRADMSAVVDILKLLLNK